MSRKTKYYGKYRGTVLVNLDPEQIGRIQAEVPDVLGTLPSGWAMPCVPLAGAQSGTYVVPQVGAAVWVEFEGGDPDRPIWTGCFWPAPGQVPTLGLTGIPSSPNIVVQSGMQNSLVISDVPGPDGGVMLRSASGATLIVNDTGIYIQNGKGASIVMVGPSVSVNEGAWVVP